MRLPARPLWPRNVSAKPAWLSEWPGRDAAAADRRSVLAFGLGTGGANMAPPAEMRGLPLPEGPLRQLSGMFNEMPAPAAVNRFFRLPFFALGNEVCCFAALICLKAPASHRKDRAMAHNYAINDDVHHQLQGPQGRAVVKQRSVYTIVSRLPIEADGRPRYRIKSKTENVERVVTEEQISRLG
jgi:hypothetical protein